jgi:hypothetical protein
MQESVKRRTLTCKGVACKGAEHWLELRVVACSKMVLCLKDIVHTMQAVGAVEED